MWVSEELSKELFELSGWIDPMAQGCKAYPDTPYYSLGYLMRKLQAGDLTGFTVKYVSDIRGIDLPEWRYKYVAYLPWMQQRYYPIADTPEDAACKLAIELFKQGILTKEKQ